MSGYRIRRLRRIWSRLLRGESGQGLIEYALIIGVVSIGAVISLGFLSGKIQKLYTSSAGNGLNGVLCSGKQPNETPPEGCTGPSSGSTAGGGSSTEHYQGNSGALTLWSLLLGLGAHSPNYNTDCHYTWSYTYYAADVVDGHGGAQSDLEGLYTPGKVPAASDDQAVCGLAGLLAGINTFANLPPNPPTSWNIGGYPVTCTWHSFPGGQLEYWQVGSTLYWHGCFAVPAPTNTAPPVVTPNSGILRGDQLHSTSGTWTHLPDSYSYTWQRCADSSGNGCSDIASGNNDYTTVQGDVGKYVRAAVVAVNEGGPSAPAYSNVVGPVQVLQNTVAPSIGVRSGSNCNAAATATDTQTLCVRSTGTWSPNTGLSFTYQWQANGTDVGGATGTTLNLTAALTGKQLTVLVTAHRNSGADSDPVASNGINVTATPPSGSVAIGSCGSTITVGETCTADTSGVSGTTPINYTYDWKTCTSSAGTGCGGTLGTNNSYVAACGDAGRFLKLTVVATNAASPGGVTFTRTNGSTVTGCNPPTGSVAIGNCGSTINVGETCTADTSGVSGTTPINYTYDWKTCTSSAGTGCGGTLGTNNNYVVACGDAGRFLKLTVVATNVASPGGVTFTRTNGTVVTACSPPSGSVAIQGCSSAPIDVGDGCTADTSNVNGSAPIAFTYDWRSCTTSAGTTCGGSGGTGSSYTVACGDAGRFIKLTVVATNPASPGGVTFTRTNTSMATPCNSVAPTIARVPSPPCTTALGSPPVGTQLCVASQGTWTGQSSLANQWMRCSNSSSTGSCNTIVGATGTTYTVTNSDRFNYIRLRVRATNAGGTRDAFSAPTGQIP